MTFELHVVVLIRLKSTPHIHSLSIRVLDHPHHRTTLDRINMNARFAILTIFGAVLFASVATAQVPSCSISYCTTKGSKAACSRPKDCRNCPSKPKKGQRINCGWWIKSQSVRCPRFCRFRGCRNPLFDSSGKKHCNWCSLRKASCKSHFDIFGPVDKSSPSAKSCPDGCAWKGNKCVCDVKSNCEKGCSYSNRFRKCICKAKPKCASGCDWKWGKCHCDKKRGECRRMGCRFNRGKCSCTPTFCEPDCKYVWRTRKCICPQKPVDCKKFGEKCFYRNGKCRCPKGPKVPMPSPDADPLKL